MQEKAKKMQIVWEWIEKKNICTTVHSIIYPKIANQWNMHIYVYGSVDGITQEPVAAVTSTKGAA